MNFERMKFLHLLFTRVVCNRERRERREEREIRDDIIETKGSTSGEN